MRNADVQAARTGQLPTGEWGDWWAYARRVARLLAAGVPVPPGPNVFGPVLRPGEQIRLQSHVGYSRLYAVGDGSWSTPGAILVGNTSMMVGALVGSAIARSRARAAAADAAQLRWREQQVSPVIVTDRRILCDVEGRGWLSFWLAEATEFHPSLGEWSMVLGYNDGAAPVQLQGPAAVGIVAWSAPSILGESWVKDPRLAHLLR